MITQIERMIVMKFRQGDTVIDTNGEIMKIEEWITKQFCDPEVTRKEFENKLDSSITKVAGFSRKNHAR